MKIYNSTKKIFILLALILSVNNSIFAAKTPSGGSLTDSPRKRSSQEDTPNPESKAHKTKTFYFSEMAGDDRNALEILNLQYDCEEGSEKIIKDKTVDPKIIDNFQQSTGELIKKLTEFFNNLPENFPKKNEEALKNYINDLNNTQTSSLDKKSANIFITEKPSYAGKFSGLSISQIQQQANEAFIGNSNKKIETLTGEIETLTGEIKTLTGEIEALTGEIEKNLDNPNEKTKELDEKKKN